MEKIVSIMVKNVTWNYEHIYRPVFIPFIYGLPVNTALVHYQRSLYVTAQTVKCFCFKKQTF